MWWFYSNFLERFGEILKYKFAKFCFDVSADSILVSSFLFFSFHFSLYLNVAIFEFFFFLFLQFFRRYLTWISWKWSNSEGKTILSSLL